MFQADPAVISTGLAGLGGSIVGGGLIYLALRERLRGLFATREEVRSVASTVHGLSTRADQTADRLMRLETQTESVLQPLIKLSDRLDVLASQSAAQGEAIRGLGRSIDQLREELNRDRP